jgi:hypothetical protein
MDGISPDVLVTVWTNANVLDSANAANVIAVRFIVVSFVCRLDKETTAPSPLKPFLGHTPSASSQIRSRARGSKQAAIPGFPKIRVF